MRCVVRVVGKLLEGDEERRLVQLVGLQRKPSSVDKEGCCSWCGKPVAYKGRGRKPKYCSRSCRQRAYEYRLMSNSELFTFLRKFDRCYLCGERLDWSDPLDVCLDHVIPTIRGGMTIPENLRSVHVECNAIKGEKLLDPSEFGLR